MIQTLVIIGIFALVGIIGIIIVCCLISESRKLDSDRQAMEDKAQEEWCEKVNKGK